MNKFVENRDKMTSNLGKIARNEFRQMRKLKTPSDWASWKRDIELILMSGRLTEFLKPTLKFELVNISDRVTRSQLTNGTEEFFGDRES